MAKSTKKTAAIDAAKEDMPAAQAETMTNEEAQAAVDSGEASVPEEAKMTHAEAMAPSAADHAEAMAICRELATMKDRPDYDWKNTFNSLHGRAKKLIKK